MPYLGEFQAANLKKTIVIFQISTLELDKNKFLSKTVNFDIGSTFCEGSGSGPGSLDKVCL